MNNYPMRAAFEKERCDVLSAYHRLPFMASKDKDREYLHHETRREWNIWQAAWRACEAHLHSSRQSITIDIIDGVANVRPPK